MPTFKHKGTTPYSNEEINATHKRQESLVKSAAKLGIYIDFFLSNIKRAVKLSCFKRAHHATFRLDMSILHIYGNRQY